MAREKGTFNFSANLEVKKQGPLDARQTMITYAELTQAATWQDDSGKMYLFNGLTVPVTNGSSKELYMLIDANNYNQTASWKRVDAGAAEGTKIYDLTGISVMSTPQDIEDILGKPNTFLSEIKKGNILGKFLFADKDIKEPVEAYSLFYSVGSGTTFEFEGGTLPAENGYIILYSLFKSSIKYLFIPYDADANSYLSLKVIDTTYSLLNNANIAKKLAFSYKENEVATADVLKRVVLLGDITSLRVGSDITTLKNVFSNILINSSLDLSSFEDVVQGIYESYQSLSDSLFYSVKRVTDFSANKLIRVELTSANPMASESDVYIELNYIYGDKSYTLGLSRESGVKTITEKWIGSDVYHLPGDLMSLTSESTPEEIENVLGEWKNVFSLVVASNRIITFSSSGDVDSNIVVHYQVKTDGNIDLIFSVGAIADIVTIEFSGGNYSGVTVTQYMPVQKIAATTNKGIEIGGTPERPTVGLKLDTTTPGNVSLSVGANGLKANFTETTKGVKSGDKVLKVESDKTISSTIGLAYSSETKKLQLTGINQEVFAELDATPFIKDGMLNSATLEVNPSGQSAGTYLKLVFNTDSGKDPMYINVTSLIDVYTQGNGISISGKSISVKIDSSTEKYLSVSAAGLKLSGVNQAIADAITDAFKWHDA